jgi:hypothetical protein
MKIEIKTKESVINLFQKSGYVLSKQVSENEFSFLKRLGGGDYPRFHAYVKKDNGVIIINLHLDQKRPSYKGSHAHNAEYFGELVESEAERIKKIADKISKEL